MTEPRIKTDLEKEFDSVVAAHAGAIQLKLQHASQLMEEAIALSEAHGIPFFSYVSLLAQSYVPESLQPKFGPLIDVKGSRPYSDPDSDFNDVDARTIKDVGAGWEHSAIC